MRPQDMRKLMEQAQQMQEQMVAHQEELAAQNFEGTAGGGVVKATVTGGGSLINAGVALRPDARVFADEAWPGQILQDGLLEEGFRRARLWLNPQSDPRAAERLTRFALMPPERAAQRVRFIDQYRSYVINYNLGQDMVRRYVGANAKTPEERWTVFGELLSSPRLPSGLLP